jgi:hypothetical protein
MSHTFQNYIYIVLYIFTFECAFSVCVYLLLFIFCTFTVEDGLTDYCCLPWNTEAWSKYKLHIVYYHHICLLIK